MNYDAIVIGAGPAGSATALLLARAGRSVAIVEKTPFPRCKVCGEFISAQALDLLARMGANVRDAGAEVREVAVYAGDRIAAAAMPALKAGHCYGRALGREHLDTMLLDLARRAGAVVYQPWRVADPERKGGGFACVLRGPAADVRLTLAAPVVIAAHGSWDTGGLRPRRQLPRPHRAPSDLLAFKARFSGAALEPHRMPLVAFSGGYGGLVHTGDGCVSFSCCIRRDALAAIRAAAPGVPAGSAVLDHVLRECRGVRVALHGARLEGRWLAAGPLRPGFEAVAGEGYFAVGNALGEAHPIVAEGISMAIQSAWLLCERLCNTPRAASAAHLSSVARDYEAAYRRHFRWRMRAASAYAALAMRPRAAAAVAVALRFSPFLLECGARLAGKARPLHTTV